MDAGRRRFAHGGRAAKSSPEESGIKKNEACEKHDDGGGPGVGGPRRRLGVTYR